MIKRFPSPYGDLTCSSCVVAGDYIFLGHHSGGHESPDIVHQMQACFNSLQDTLKTVGATMGDMVQINLYLKRIDDFRAARDVFYEYFKEDQVPARMTTTTDFVTSTCLCMLDGIAYKKQNGL